MSKKEEFFTKVYEIVSELKLPLIDDRIQSNTKFETNSTMVIIKFTFDQDEAVIYGFLGLAEYFHKVVIKNKESFYIPHDLKLFILEKK
ncbi:MAG: hypothetical protein ACFFDH_25390 [Promethearchaeota archaeon]